ncbi:hypothetical protein JCM3766R1_005252 [Sporobolomyces carnicolor]
MPVSSSSVDVPLADWQIVRIIGAKELPLTAPEMISFARKHRLPKIGYMPLGDESKLLYAAFDSWIAAATFRLSADLQADSLAADRFLLGGPSSKALPIGYRLEDAPPPAWLQSFSYDTDGDLHLAPSKPDER